jgi:hypothetical protein
MDTPPAVLYADYESTSIRLQNALSELAQARAAQLEAKIATWFNTPADTLKQRDMQADQAAGNFTRDIFVMQGECDALRERLSLIDHVIAFRNLP